MGKRLFNCRPYRRGKQTVLARIRLVIPWTSYGLIGNRDSGQWEEAALRVCPQSEAVWVEEGGRATLTIEWKDYRVTGASQAER